MNPKRFSLLVIGLSATAFVGIAVTNWLVNPYAQYGTSFVPPMVQMSRSTKVSLLESRSDAPGGLVLGSSRVLKLEPKYIEKKLRTSFFNAGVNYGKPEDHLAMLRYCRRRFEDPPKFVILGLDVHGFSDALPTDARLLSHPALVQEISDSVPFEARFTRFKELLSWQQTIASVKSVRHCRNRDRNAAPSESFQNDGLLVYHQREREIREGTYDFSAALDYNKHEYEQLFANYDSLSAKRLAMFEKLVEECSANGTRLSVFLTPMHPALASHLAGTSYPSRLVELRSFLTQQAETSDFNFCDLSDLQTFGGDPSLFVDGIHPLEPNTRRMIDRIVEQTGLNSHYAVQ